MKTHSRISSAIVLLVALSCVSSVWAQQEYNRNSAQILSTFARYMNITPNDAQTQTLHVAQKEASVSWPALIEAVHNYQLPFAQRKLTLQELRVRGGVALLHLRKPEAFVILKSLGSRQALVDENGHDMLIENVVLMKRMTGKVLVPIAKQKQSQMQIDDPVRVVKLSTIGGEVELVEKVRILNRGRTPLNLEVGRISCGCTGAEVSPKSIMPGETAVLTMKMHVEYDERLVTVDLHSSDPQWPWAVVGIQSAMPKTKIAVPQRLSFYANKGQSTTQSFSVTLPDGILVSRLESHQPFLSTKLIGESSVSGKHHRVEIRLAADAPEGAFSDQIALHLKGGDVRQLLVPVAGFVSNDVSAEPRMVLLGNVENGTTIRKTILLQGPQDRLFSVKSTRNHNPTITVEANPAVVASSHAVEVVVRVQGKADSLLQDRVTLVLSDNRELDIDIIGTIAKNATGMATNVASKVVSNLPAPDFLVSDMNGKAWKLSVLKGQKNLLLTFFPKCFTGGCANHLSSLRDHQDEFNAADTQILAVSVDPAEGEKGQIAFAKQWNLTFPLIPDTDRKLSLLYGAVQTPTDLDSRMSVFIDKHGIVRFIDRDVNVMTHGADVLNTIRELGLGK
jgi:peroxiredoxin